MCGRFTLSTPAATLADIFELPGMPEIPARYNIAPTETVVIVRKPNPELPRELAMLHWGLIPSWSKDGKAGGRMINARSETASTSPAFRVALRQRRCLLLADGFYEWQRQERGKQPFYIRMRDGLPFAFAGLWERWKGASGTVIESCTLLTTQPNELMAPIHDRMPVILDPDDYALWLDPMVHDLDAIQPLLRPFDPAKMTDYPVTTLVNNPANDDPDCVRPLSA